MTPPAAWMASGGGDPFDAIRGVDRGAVAAFQIGRCEKSAARRISFANAFQVIAR